MRRGLPLPTPASHIGEQSSLWLELDFDRFPGFVRSGLELPMPNGRYRTLGEKWVSTLHFYRFDGAIRQHQRLDLDDAVYVHGTSKRRIDRWSLDQDFPSTLSSFLGSRWNGS